MGWLLYKAAEIITHSRGSSPYSWANQEVVEVQLNDQSFLLTVEIAQAIGRAGDKLAMEK